jgi:hypothetical protein
VLKLPSTRSAHLAVVVALAGALPSGAIAPAVGVAAATLPPGLIALEQRMETLKISSSRFSLRTSIKLPRSDRGIKCLLKLFGSGSQVSGEATTTPAAANVSFELFGTRWGLRMVGSAVYLHLRELGRYDGRRPWIKLGKGGLAELFTVNGLHMASTAPLPSEPKLAEPPFAGFQKILAGAREVRELGPATVDGQPVTRFLAVLEPAQLKSEPLASSASVTPSVAAVTASFEVSIAASGLPVRTVINVHSAGTTTIATLDIPQVNFPLVIKSPPASKTITARHLRQLEKDIKSPEKTKEPRNPFAGC